MLSLMSTAVARVEDHYPKEVPSFEPPLPPVLAQIEGSLEKVSAATESYLQEREAMVEFWEADVDVLEEVVAHNSLTGGNPRLDDLIHQAGEHLEMTKAEILPRIEEFSRMKRQAGALRLPKAQMLLMSVIDRNLALMRRYLKAIEASYHHLIILRDRSIQQSIAGLTEASWAGLWDDDN
jgi:hypothetical protein